MGRITSYPETTELGASDIFLVDGSNGTRKVSAPNAASEFAKLDEDSYRLTSRLNGAGFDATKIPNGANLNTLDYIRQGRYYCDNNELVSSYQNCPVLVPFMMEVMSLVSPNVDDESTGVWVYRLRKITTVTGHIKYQYVYSQDTAGIFTYDDWFEVVTSASDYLIQPEMIVMDHITTIGGDFTSIGNWISANFVPDRVINVKVTPTSSGYFGTASFEIRAQLTTSGHYGWATLQSDNPNVIVFGRLSNDVWSWFTTQLVDVSSGSKNDLVYSNSYTQSANAWIDTIQHTIPVSGLYSIHTAFSAASPNRPLGIALCSIDANDKLTIYGVNERTNNTEGSLGLSKELLTLSLSNMIYLEAGTTIQIRTKAVSATAGTVRIRINHIG